GTGHGATLPDPPAPAPVHLHRARLRPSSGATRAQPATQTVLPGPAQQGWPAAWADLGGSRAPRGLAQRQGSAEKRRPAPAPVPLLLPLARRHSWRGAKWPPDGAAPTRGWLRGPTVRSRAARAAGTAPAEKRRSTQSSPRLPGAHVLWHQQRHRRAPAG